MSRSAVLLAESPTTEYRPDDYYSPRRVELLLKQLPFLAFYAQQPRREGESPSGTRPYRNPDEGRMTVRGDLIGAIEQLSDFQQIVVWETAVFCRPYRQVADKLGVSHMSIGRYKRQAIEDISYRLGWREHDVE